MTEPTSPSDVQAATAPAVEEVGGGDKVADVAVKKEQNVTNEVLKAQANLNPKLIHSLASLLESHDEPSRKKWKSPKQKQPLNVGSPLLSANPKLSAPSRYSKVLDHLSKDGRVAHTVGELASIYGLPSDVVGGTVELALQMFGCQQDQASRISSVKFFTSAFMFSAILDSFDSKDSLKKFLNILQSVGSVLSGGVNATPHLELSTALEKQKQMAYHICGALRQYFRAHLLLLIDTLNGGSGDLASNKTLDISNQAINEVFVQIRTDGHLARKLAWACWPVVQQFLE